MRRYRGDDAGVVPLFRMDDHRGGGQPAGVYAAHLGKAQKALLHPRHDKPDLVKMGLQQQVGRALFPLIDAAQQAAQRGSRHLAKRGEQLLGRRKSGTFPTAGAGGFAQLFGGCGYFFGSDIHGVPPCIPSGRPLACRGSFSGPCRVRASDPPAGREKSKPAFPLLPIGEGRAPAPVRQGQGSSKKAYFSALTSAL